MTKARIWIALAVLAAFLAGSLFVGYIAPRFSNTQAALPAQTQVAAREPAPQPLLLSAGPAANTGSDRLSKSIVSGSTQRADQLRLGRAAAILISLCYVRRGGRDRAAGLHVAGEPVDRRYCPSWASPSKRCESP